jgi:hypothetical protein
MLNLGIYHSIESLNEVIKVVKLILNDKSLGRKHTGSAFDFTGFSILL